MFSTRKYQPQTYAFGLALLGAAGALAWRSIRPPAPLPCPEGCRSTTSAARPDTAAAKARSAKARETYGRLPLQFEPNQGQLGEHVAFASRGPGYSLFLTPTEAVLSLRNQKPSQTNPASVVRMQLMNANPSPHLEGQNALPGKTHYLKGNNPQAWRRSVSTYAKVQYRDVYPGVDLVYYGNQRQLEYDFVVAPGANPEAITLAFAGADKLEVDGRGDLVLHTKNGLLRWQKPVVYQPAASATPASNTSPRQTIAGRYVQTGKNQIGFQVAAYDARRPLVIDPVLRFSTAFGGSGNEQGWDIAVDTAGNSYVTGTTNSPDFPTTAGPIQPAAGDTDAFVAKLSPDGTTLVYSTYLGGTRAEAGLSVAVDASGSAYLTGQTASFDDPSTPQNEGFPLAHALQPAFGGQTDAFVAKLSADGSDLTYATFLGGGGDDAGLGITVDASGSAYLTGQTGSTNFLLHKRNRLTGTERIQSTGSNVGGTSNALQPAFGGGASDAFVAKLPPNGATLAYATFLGGADDDAGSDIAIDASGSAYVTGTTRSFDDPSTPQNEGFPLAQALQPVFGGQTDAFVAKLSRTGATLAYSTYLGGGNDDRGEGIALDPAGNAFVVGATSSPDFPTVNYFRSGFQGGASDAFVAKLRANGSSLAYATFLGGGGSDGGRAIAVDANGSAYVTGTTRSPNFPISTRPPQYYADGTPPPFALAGGSDAFLTQFTPSGKIVIHSTFLGGSDDDYGLGVAVDANGNALLVGATSSTPFPSAHFLQPALGNGDAFITKIARVPLPDLLVDSSILQQSVRVMTRTFNATHPAVIEELVVAGTRRLLNFSTATPNYGDGDLLMGRPADRPEVFVWSPAHGHYHFSDYADYTLLDGDSVVATGRKQAFCLLDLRRYTLGAPTRNYTCSFQGISAGWGDVYDRSLDGQWIDITGIAAGSYTLEVSINPARSLPESDYSNNIVRIPVTIP